jgi:hypothetical protein
VIAAAALVLGLLATAPDDRAPHRHLTVSRSAQNRWHDSGIVEVWRGASSHERAVWLCIRAHESLGAGHWTAQNGSSSASGAGQWIDSTWRGVARWVTFRGKHVARGYTRARYAPPWIQDLAFRHTYARGGLSMWAGTHCAGTS